MRSVTVAVTVWVESSGNWLSAVAGVNEMQRWESHANALVALASEATIITLRASMRTVTGLREKAWRVFAESIIDSRSFYAEIAE
jgi:hypothetical protein